MNKLTILAAAAPIALLAACGDSDVDETTMDDDTMASDTMADDTMMADDAATGTATSQADAGDFSGVYSYAADDGSETAIRINSADNSYDYVGSDGEMRSGNYTWTPDGYRFQVGDWFGEPSYFVLSGDELVRQQGDLEYTEGSPVSGERYSRARESDAVFSRFPEPGSPVTPQD